METYSASVVGAGLGGRLSMGGLAASERYKLTAVADISPAALKQAHKDYPDAKLFDSYQEMFAECPTDVVCVSTYAPSHTQIALEALKLPLKGILVEKPLANTAKDGHTILSHIRAKALPAIVPHGMLVSYHVPEILHKVHAGDIGELVMVEIESAKWDIINAGIHWVNFFMVLVKNEPIDSVMAICDTSTRTYRDGMQVETAAVCYAQTRSGTRLVMNTGDDIIPTTEDRDTVFRLVGRKGIIEFWAWPNEYEIINAQHPQGQRIVVQGEPSVGHQRHLEALADQMDKGEPDYTVAQSSLMALEVCEAAYMSSRHRCRVKFPLDTFTPPQETDWDPGAPYSGKGGGRNGNQL